MKAKNHTQTDKKDNKKYLEFRLTFSALLNHISSVPHSVTENIKKSYVTVTKQLNNASHIFSVFKNSKAKLINSNQENLNKYSRKFQKALSYRHRHRKNSAQLKWQKDKLSKYNIYTTFDIEENAPLQIEQFMPQSPIAKKTTPYQHAIQYAYDLLQSKSSSYDSFQHILTLNILSEFDSKVARHVESKVAYQWHKCFATQGKMPTRDKSKLKKPFNIYFISKQKGNKTSSRFNYPISQLPIRRKATTRRDLTSSIFYTEGNKLFQIEKFMPQSPIAKKTTPYQHAIQYACDLLQSKSSLYNNFQHTLILNVLNIFDSKVARKLRSISTFKWHKYLETQGKMPKTKRKLAKEFNIYADIKEDKGFQIEQPMLQSSRAKKISPYQHAINYAHKLIQSDSPLYNDFHYTLALDRLRKANVNDKTLLFQLALKYKDPDTAIEYLLTTNKENYMHTIFKSSITHEEAADLIHKLSKMKKYNRQTSNSHNHITKHIKHTKNYYEDIVELILTQAMSSKSGNISDQTQYNTAVKESMDLLLNLPFDFVTSQNHNAPSNFSIYMKSGTAKNMKYTNQNTFLKQYASLLTKINTTNFGLYPSNYIEKIDIITQALQEYGIDEKKIIDTIQQSLNPLYTEYKSLSTGSEKNKFQYKNPLLYAASSSTLDKNSLLSKAYQQLKKE